MEKGSFWRQNAEEGMKRENFSKPLDLNQVQILDSFWGREQELVRKEVIPYQWEALNDRIPDAAPSYCMRNFKVAGRLMREKREQGESFVAPSYTFRGFEALPEDPEHPDENKFYGFVWLPPILNGTKATFCRYSTTNHLLTNNYKSIN